MGLLIGLGVVAVFGVSVVGAVAGGMFVQYKLKSGKYPQRVPGYGTVMSGCPWQPHAVKKGFDDLVREFREVYPEFGKRVVKAKLDGLMVEFIEAYGQRYVEKDGKKLAGYHRGNKIVVVFRAGDDVGDTAFLHEAAHELEELFGPISGHKRIPIWGRLADNFDPDHDEREGIVQRVEEMNR
ncbi:MAG: hypothetical protein B7733_15145 [Myxococcales bacterium FL481]|nr:MAG: hypothetical protein B7733_15145 [Myxococcales bacterium FL481]